MQREEIIAPIIFFVYLMLAAWLIKAAHADERWFILVFLGPLILLVAILKKGQDKD